MKNRFIDLGLPSGKKWASRSEKGFYTFDEAVKKFGKNLPSKEDFEELVKYCKSAWDAKRKGRVFTGPNGKSIFLPAAGYRNNYSSVYYKDSCGNYLSSSAFDEGYAYCLWFNNKTVDPVGYNGFCNAITVCLARNS